MKARWHRSSEEHIARYGVAWSEIEQAMQPPIVVDTTARGPLRVLGQTYSGRVLAMFVAPDLGASTVYDITARTADDGERRIYRRRGGKG